MPLEGTTIILLFVATVLVVGLFAYSCMDEAPIKNQGSLTYPKAATATGVNNIPVKATDLDVSLNDEQRKMFSKNSAKNGYKKSNYAEGSRESKNADLDSLFSENNNLVEQSQLGDNGGFTAYDETRGHLSAYLPGSPKSTSDPFTADDYLPKEQSKDWFEVMPEPISVKNRHLINISQAIGINTIGTSNKNASYDLRGNPPNPKFVVSPWMQSSIEPDTNIKGLC